MNDTYRLVFRAEVLEGQHKAVVKKRLAQALKLSEAQAQQLFSGEAVVLKKATDAKTAARFQGLFKEAGAKLRVVPLGEPSLGEPLGGETEKTGQPQSKPSGPEQPSSRESSGQSETERSNPNTTTSDSADQKPPESGGATIPIVNLADSSDLLCILPFGAEVLMAEERPTVNGVNVSIDHLEIVRERAKFVIDDGPSPESVMVIEAPEFSLADVGADILEGYDDQHLPLPEIEVEFDLADVGSDMGEIKRVLDALNPDISHLEVVSE